MDNCVFCKIVKGEIPCHKVFENDDVLAFLDIEPCSDGHTIVIPKRHIEHFEDMSPEYSGKLFSGVNKVYREVLKKLKIPAANVGFNNHAPAGQVVSHMHVHIIPRRDDDEGGSMHSIVKIDGAADYVKENAKLFK